MQEFARVMIVATLTIFTVLYSLQVWRGKAHPPLSSWIIFLLGTLLSLITYLLAQDYDFTSGIQNTADILAVVIVLIVMLLRGNHTIHLKPFEWWYLVGIGIIIIYGVLSGDAWTSNLFTQVLITIGYIPTIHGLLVEKRNTESFIWVCDIIASSFALYLAIMNNNMLTFLYALRTLIVVSFLVSLMLYYQFYPGKHMPHQKAAMG